MTSPFKAYGSGGSDLADAASDAKRIIRTK
jgi:hypothetical protein